MAQNRGGGKADIRAAAPLAAGGTFSRAAESRSKMVSSHMPVIDEIPCKYWEYQHFYGIMGLSKREGFQAMSEIEQEYKDHIRDLEQQILLLKEQVDFLTRKLYGTKSEKTSSLQIEGQMSLFNEAESCTDPDASELDLVEVEEHLRKRKYTGQREKLTGSLPHSKVLRSEERRVGKECRL